MAWTSGGIYLFHTIFEARVALELCAIILMPLSKATSQITVVYLDDFVNIFCTYIK